MSDMGHFQPNWLSAPGETIADLLDRHALSTDEFARQMGFSVKRVTELLDGRAPITKETAARLTNVVGASTDFWLKREAQYRQDIARLRSKAEAIPNKNWLAELPVSDMKKKGWIHPTAASGGDLQACLDFFDVASVDAWRAQYEGVFKMAAFRTSSTFPAQPGAVAVWLRRGEIEADSIPCAPWDRRQFKESLKTIRSLTRKHDPADFMPMLQELCAKCGVAVVILPAPAGCRASGATRFLSTRKALLQLSVRYRVDDHFWFTFFHEAGHLLLHSKTAVFVEDSDMISTDEEDDANAFAAEYLIPAKYRDELASLRPNKRELIKFAFRLGIAPGIVVGQMQHLKYIKHSQMNFLKRRYEWRTEND